MRQDKISSDINHTLKLFAQINEHFGGPDKVQSVIMSNQKDIEAFRTAIFTCITNPWRFLDGIAILFIYGYMVGQVSKYAQKSDELISARSRLDSLVNYGAIGIYDADQLIEDIKLVLEATR